MLTFSPKDKNIIRSFLDGKSNKINATSSLDELYSLTNNEELDLIKKILDINPREYGFFGKELVLEDIPKSIVKFNDDYVKREGEAALSEFQLMPKHIYDAFIRMNQAFMLANPSRRLIVESSYRAPALQIVTLLHLLAIVYDFDLNETLKRVALPNYSQHCSVSSTAVDIMNIEGSPSDTDPLAFKDSIEYKWLKDNANNYSFYESYPPGNEDGIMWEPWHWQYRQ